MPKSLPAAKKLSPEKLRKQFPVVVLLSSLPAGPWGEVPKNFNSNGLEEEVRELERRCSESLGLSRNEPHVRGHPGSGRKVNGLALTDKKVGVRAEYGAFLLEKLAVALASEGDAVSAEKAASTPANTVIRL